MKTLVALLILLFPVSAFGASFDCNKAGTTVEKTICASPELGLLDEELAIAYQSQLAITQQPHILKSDQRRWISEIRNKCEDDRECLSLTYKNRIAAITGQTTDLTELQEAPPQLAETDIPSYTPETENITPEYRSIVKQGSQENQGVTVAPKLSRQNNLAPVESVSTSAEKNESKEDESDLMWKLIGLALLVNAIITIYLHKAGKLVIYQNYTDIAFTGLAPLVTIVAFFILRFFEVPTEGSQVVSFLVFTALFYVIARSTYRSNGLSFFFLMSLVAKLTIVIGYYAIMVFLIFRLGSTRKKGERRDTYEARKRREGKASVAAMVVATFGFVSLSAWVCEDSEFISLGEYLSRPRVPDNVG